jgi:hypothetical protein
MKKMAESRLRDSRMSDCVDIYRISSNTHSIL